MDKAEGPDSESRRDEVWDHIQPRIEHRDDAAVHVASDPRPDLSQPLMLTLTCEEVGLEGGNEAPEAQDEAQEGRDQTQRHVDQEVQQDLRRWWRARLS